MANIKSAKKRILVNQTKALQNQMVKSQLKTVIKKFNAAVDAGDKAAASELYKLAVKKIDQLCRHRGKRHLPDQRHHRRGSKQIFPTRLFFYRRRHIKTPSRIPPEAGLCLCLRRIVFPWRSALMRRGAP